MIVLALAIPVVAMLGMLGLARIERSLDALTAPEPSSPVRHSRATPAIRLRRSHQWGSMTAHPAVTASLAPAEQSARVLRR